MEAGAAGENPGGQQSFSWPTKPRDSSSFTDLVRASSNIARGGSKTADTAAEAAARANAAAGFASQPFPPPGQMLDPRFPPGVDPRTMRAGWDYAAMQQHLARTSGVEPGGALSSEEGGQGMFVPLQRSISLDASSPLAASLLMLASVSERSTPEAPAGAGTPGAAAPGRHPMSSASMDALAQANAMAAASAAAGFAIGRLCIKCFGHRPFLDEASFREHWAHFHATSGEDPPDFRALPTTLPPAASLPWMQPMYSADMAAAMMGMPPGAMVGPGGMYPGSAVGQDAALLAAQQQQQQQQHMQHGHKRKKSLSGSDGEGDSDSKHGGQPTQTMRYRRKYWMAAQSRHADDAPTQPDAPPGPPPAVEAPLPRPPPAPNVHVRQPRWVWPPDLHKAFVEAYEQLDRKGNARQIYEQMQRNKAPLNGITLTQVRSHLQKYLLKLADGGAEKMSQRGGGGGSSSLRVSRADSDAGPSDTDAPPAAQAADHAPLAAARSGPTAAAAASSAAAAATPAQSQQMVFHPAAGIPGMMPAGMAGWNPALAAAAAQGRGPQGYPLAGMHMAGIPGMPGMGPINPTLAMAGFAGLMPGMAGMPGMQGFMPGMVPMQPAAPATPATPAAAPASAPRAKSTSRPKKGPDSKAAKPAPPPPTPATPAATPADPPVAAALPTPSEVPVAPPTPGPVAAPPPPAVQAVSPGTEPPVAVPATPTSSSSGEADAGFDAARPHKKRNRRAASEIFRPWKCSISGCGKSYGNRGSLSTHVMLKHSDVTHQWTQGSQQERTCKCGDVFTSATEFRTHMRHYCPLVSDKSIEALHSNSSHTPGSSSPSSPESSMPLTQPTTPGSAAPEAAHPPEKTASQPPSSSARTSAAADAASAPPPPQAASVSPPMEAELSQIIAKMIEGRRVDGPVELRVVVGPDGKVQSTLVPLSGGAAAPSAPPSASGTSASASTPAASAKSSAVSTAESERRVSVGTPEAERAGSSDAEMSPTQAEEESDHADSPPSSPED